MLLQTLPETSLASTTVLRKPESVRVRLNDGDGGRLLPLVEGKTTIGSSPQCTIVLPGSDSRPLQCVLAVDENRVEATRWGAGVQLNRRDFTKSVVAAGDRLTIGACEILFEEAKSSVETTPATTTESPAEIDQPKQEPARVAEPTLPAKPTVAEAPPVAATQTATPVEVVAPTPAEVVLPTKPAVEPAAVGSEPAQPTPVALLPAPAAAEKPASVEIPATSRTTVVTEPQAPPALGIPVKLAAATTAAPAAAAAESATLESLVPALVDVQPAALTSLAFADELILQLWQASETSKQRTKHLIAATRDARFRTNAMAADLAAMEVELDLARAAYDSHAADHEQLHLELIERDRRAAERIGPLAAEVDQLRSQLQQSQVELAEQAARCDQLNAALETAQTEVARQAHAQAADETRRTTELEQSLTVQIEQATMLARELGQVRTELEGVRAELEQHAARRAELEVELAEARGEIDRHQQALVAAAERDAAAAGLHDQLSSLHAEREELHQRLADADQQTTRLAELCQASADRVVALEQSLQRATDSAVAREPQAQQLGTPEPSEAIDAAAVETEPEPALDSTPTLDEVGWNVEPQETSTPIEEAPLVAWDALAPVDSEAHDSIPADEPEPATFALGEPALAEPALVESAAHDPEPETQQPGPSPFAPSTPVATRPVESETAGTSFIDKYRHLLDDDGDASAAAPSLHVTAPIIDDEFLSPAKAAARTVPADDSDEALDAYMASMMERMRGATTTVSPLLAAEPIVPVTASESSPRLDYDPSEPFDIESMKQGRRAPVSTDLAALREIANTSARTAIETHRNRKKVESTFGKMIVALIAVGASAYLLLNAPSLYDWQFGTGIVVALIGFSAAALAMRHPDRHTASHALAD